MCEAQKGGRNFGPYMWRDSSGRVRRGDIQWGRASRNQMLFVRVPWVSSFRAVRDGFPRALRNFRVQDALGFFLAALRASNAPSLENSAAPRVSLASCVRADSVGQLRNYYKTIRRQTPWGPSKNTLHARSRGNDTKKQRKQVEKARRRRHARTSQVTKVPSVS